MSEIQQPHIKEKFIKKLDEAKKVLKGESLLLLSVNYLNEDIDFSFHTLADLYARVDYIAKIEKNGEHNEIKELISVNENKDEHLKKHCNIWPATKSTNTSVAQKNLSERKP